MKRLWSPNRPQRPARDPLLAEVVRLLERDRRSYWDLADDSGLSPSTLRNWEHGKVRNPQSVSLQMAARSLGKRLVLK